jgi:hypothetical protein
MSCEVVSSHELCEMALTAHPEACQTEDIRCPEAIAKGPKREYGEDDPKGAKAVTAPATVSGWIDQRSHWETGKADHSANR